MLNLLSLGENGWGTLILSATLTTLLLSLAALAVGAGVGGVIAAAKLSRHAPARWFGAAWSVVFRGIPELLVIYLFYFGGSGMISWLGRLFGADGFIEVPPFLIGALAIGLISSSYQAEVYRAARLALMPGEVEAATAIGMPRWRILQRILLPQIVRYSLPVTLGLFICSFMLGRTGLKILRTLKSVPVRLRPWAPLICASSSTG